MAYKSITKRWVANSLSIILFVLTVAVLVASFAIYNYYYRSVEDVLSIRAEYGDSMVDDITNTSKTNVDADIRTMVETFPQKDNIEMMAIGHDGEILVTSSGFDTHIQDSMPDFDAARKSSRGKESDVYRLKETNEKVMAMTVMLPAVSSDISALRYVVSVEQLDKTIITIILVIVAVLVVILALILITSWYFINSIVIPVQSIGKVARGFAGGDMSQRILKKSDDEIGELCDIINYMADEIEHTDKMKNEFISSVSHELRTPLTAIKGWGETLTAIDPDDTEMLHKGMHVIINETERLSNMVEELLDFSRIQNGRFTLVKTRMDLLAELEDAVLMYTERAKRDNINFLYSEPEQLSFVFGDKNRLKQVFINIIDNALKYSDSGDTVSINAVEEKGFIHVLVGDTGCGIDAKDLPKIKEKFYKANSTRRGSGIGLAVADEIVQLHGGELSVTSEAGVGTTVVIKLPVMNKENVKTKIQGTSSLD